MGWLASVSSMLTSHATSRSLRSEICSRGGARADGWKKEGRLEETMIKSFVC